LVVLDAVAAAVPELPDDPLQVADLQEDQADDGDEDLRAAHPTRIGTRRREGNGPTGPSSARRDLHGAGARNPFVNRRDFILGAAALPFALRALPALAGGTPLALVTADTESRVLAVELATGRIFRELATLPG